MPKAPTFATLAELLFGPERHAIVDALMWQRVSAWGGPLAAGVLPLGLVAVALVAITRAGRSARAALAAVGFMLVGYYVVYLLTPLDVEWLVSTTFDRVIVQIWPSLVLAALLTDDGPSPGRSPESSTFAGIRWLQGTWRNSATPSASQVHLLEFLLESLRDPRRMSTRTGTRDNLASLRAPTVPPSRHHVSNTPAAPRCTKLRMRSNVTRSKMVADAHTAFD